MRIFEVRADQLKFSDNFEWYGILYTITSIEIDYDDETVQMRVAYPRRLNGDHPVLNTITARLDDPILVHK